MNDVIKTIINHRSVRNYKPDPIDEHQLELILKSAQMAPSSVNGQQMSIIVIKDQDTKDTMAKIAGNQAYVAQAPVFLIFCLDYYRAKLAGEQHDVGIKIVDDLDATVIGAMDVGLAMQNAIVAAESFDLGTVPIGGIRNDSLAIAKLCNLPDYVFPLCGLVIGHPEDPSAIKPRLPKESVIFDHHYNHDLKPLIEEYDNTMSDYMKKRTNGLSDRNWSSTIAGYYQNRSSRSTKQDMKQKGFKNE